MATETVEQITRAAPFVEAAGKTYLDELQKATGQFKTADLSKVFGPQFVAGQDPLQAQAQQIATQGIGAYQPFLQSAAAQQAAAAGLTGPQAYQQFMSPYQQASDRNRAALQAQLLQSGFGQAQTAAQQAFANQQALSAAQLNLARGQQQFLGQDVGALSTLGGVNQAQRQAELQAQQQLAQQQLNQPMTAAQQYGQGVTSLIAGYPGQISQGQVPVPGALQTGLSAGATLAGIYRAFGD